MDTLATLCLASAPPVRPETFWSAWSLAPSVLLPLLAALLLVRHSGGRERALFLLGWLLLAVALVSPLCRLAAATASGHMLQHVILVALAPPLLVLGLPAGRWRRHLPGPLAASILYAAAVWLSHAPPIYEATLLGPALHLGLLGLLAAAGLAFWSSALLAAPTVGHAALMAFAAMTHTTLLGALLALSPEPWYPLFAGRTEAWGLTPLEDQQLAGLIMWVPMAGVYLLAALAGLAKVLTPPAATQAAGDPARSS